MYHLGRHWGIAALTVFLHGPVFAGSAQILYYEPLRVQAASTAHQKPSGQFAYAFEAFGRRFDLSLTRNERIALFKRSSSEGSTLRLYKGQVDGADGSWVRLAVRGERVHGMVWDGHELYVIEPVDSAEGSVAPPLALPASGSIVFRLSDTHMQTRASCASDGTTGRRSGLEQYKAVAAELKASSNAVLAASPSRRIEVSAIGDMQYRQGHPTEESAEDQILLRLNNVDGIFSSQVGVAIQVPTVIVEASDTSSFSATTVPNTLLSELGVVRKNSAQLRSRGLTHLFTGRDLDGDTVGVAYIDSLCDGELGVGLTQAHDLNVWIESLVAAHEIGHNFGAYHDGEDAPGNNAAECVSTANDLYLMAPRVDADHSQFSSCSRTVIRNTASSTACVTPISTADVAIDSDLGQVRALPGTTFDWTFDVTNVGSATATGTEARAFLPPSITIVEAWVTGGTCTSGAGLIDCELGSLAGGVTRTVNARLRSEDLASNTVAVHISATNDAGLNNNQGQGSVDIEPNVDLAIELIAPATAAVSEPLTPSFSVRNLSTSPAHSLTVDLTAPGGLSLVGATLEGAECAPLTAGLRCSLPELAPEATLSGTLTVNATTPGTFILSAQVGASDLDGNAANNSANASVQVTEPAAAGASASPSSSGGGGGGSLGWEILALGALAWRARRAAQGLLAPGRLVQGRD